MLIIKEERKLEIIESLKTCVDLHDRDLETHFENLHHIGKKLEDDDAISLLSQYFNILGNKERLKIIKVLNVKDYCVCELEAILDKSQSSISHHLRILEKRGLIRGVKRGYFTHYELIKDGFLENIHKFEEEYSFLLK